MEIDDAKANLIYTTKNTPWYFGSYANMARHNLFLLIKKLETKFSHVGITKTIIDDEDITKENFILEIFDPTNKMYEVDRLKIYKFLVKRHYLPFLKIFHEKKGLNLDENPIVDYSKLYAFFKEACIYLDKYRNKFTHSLAVDINGNRIEEDIIISDQFKKNICELFDYTTNLSLDRFKESQVEENFTHLKSYELVSNNQLTEHGVYFFFNLFLEKKYAMQFLKKINGFKNETIPSFQATLQCFTAYTLRSTEDSLDNIDRKQTLLLEMLNELQKCPNELFKHLSDKDKEYFRPEISNDSFNSLISNDDGFLELNDEHIDLLLNNLISLKRNDNRFPYFALRFLDEFNLLNNIRFQIRVGRVLKTSYEKTIGGEIIKRNIFKEIKAFGKLSEFEGKEEQIIKDLSIDDDFDQFNPKYNIQNNKIGFLIIENNNKQIQQGQPTGFISLHELPKIIFLALNDNTKIEKTIKDFIKRNENTILNQNYLGGIKAKLSLEPENFTRRRPKLKNLFVKRKITFLNNLERNRIQQKYQFNDDNILSKTINSNNKSSIELFTQLKYELLLKKRKNQLQNNIGKNLNVNQFPKKIIDYLLNIKSSNDELTFKLKIKDLKQQTKKQLKQFENLLINDPQKIKVGEIAKFIARDLIDMIIDKEIKHKITSAYYNKLQNKIAYFESNKNDIISICEELNLFNKSKGHCFITAEDFKKSNTILKFYEIYLTKKQSWLHSQIEKNSVPSEKKLPYSILKTINKNRNFDTWLQNKKHLPINFPKNLFDSELIEILNKKINNEKISFNENDHFGVRLDKIMENDSQPFYDFIRIYKDANDKSKTVEIDPSIHKAAKIKELSGKYADQNEKLIRFVKTQDKIVKLMCEYILNGNNQLEKIKFKLKNIEPKNSSNILNQPHEFKFKHKKINFVIVAKDSENQKAEIEYFNKLSKEVKEQFKGQKGYQWTIRDFGRFNRFLKDKRIQGLSKYIEGNEISFDLLDYQLKEYDRFREKIFKKIYDLEKFIEKNEYEQLIKNELEDRQENPKNYNEISFKIYMKTIESQDDNDLLEIRNKFSHSQIPELDIAFKITKEINEEFENKKHLKSEIANMDISIPQKLYEQLSKEIVEIKNNLSSLKYEN